MRRPSWHVLSFVLLTVIGLTLLRLGLAVSDSGAAFPAARPNTELARDFYEAVNGVLATGDPTPLTAVVSPAFAAHGLLPVQTADLAGFQGHLVALHAAFPDARLEAVDVVAGREVVMARVELRGAAGGSLGGLPVSAPVGLWGAVDTFRIDQGQVAELWSDGGGGGDLHPLFASLPKSIAPGTIVEVDHFRLTEEATSTAVAPLLLFVETGSLAISLPDSGLGEGRGVQLPFVAHGIPGSAERLIRTVAPGGATTVEPGELLGIPAGTFYQLQVTAGQGAAGLGIELIPPSQPTGPDDPTGRGGVSTTGHDPTSGERSLPVAVVTDSVMRWKVIGLSEGSRRWTAGRITLGPGASLTIGDVEGAAMLAVETGTLGLTPQTPGVLGATGVGGNVPVIPGSSVDGVDMTQGPLALGVPETLTGGRSALLLAGGRATVRNVGDDPVTFLVIVAAEGGEEGE
jgi:hypothetical protein